ncbi:MAG: hypothetical protein WC707_02995 [Candidatus Babeliaceae bacterium]|jgi:hypothetical protein
MKKNLTRLLIIVLIAGQAQIALPYNWDMFSQSTSHFFSNIYGNLSMTQQIGVLVFLGGFGVAGGGAARRFIYQKITRKNAPQTQTSNQQPVYQKNQEETVNTKAEIPVENTNFNTDAPLVPQEIQTQTPVRNISSLIDTENLSTQTQTSTSPSVFEENQERSQLLKQKSSSTQFFSQEIHSKKRKFEQTIEAKTPIDTGNLSQETQFEITEAEMLNRAQKCYATLKNTLGEPDFNASEFVFPFGLRKGYAYFDHFIVSAAKVPLEPKAITDSKDIFKRWISLIMYTPTRNEAEHPVQAGYTKPSTTIVYESYDMSSKTWERIEQKTK